MKQTGRLRVKMNDKLPDPRSDITFEGSELVIKAIMQAIEQAFINDSTIEIRWD